MCWIVSKVAGAFREKPSYEQHFSDRMMTVEISHSLSKE
jgi:hypothetical protein